MSLETLVRISNHYGSDPQLILAGGGNTSYKNGDVMYIKASGTSLATIGADGFVAMDRSALTRMWSKAYPEDEKLREAAVLTDMLASRLPGNAHKRPSVETLLHHLFQQKYVLHVHPAAVNGLCCAVDAEQYMRLLFNEAVFVPSVRPGYTLAVLCRHLMDRYINRYARYPRLLFLQNHGVFFAADSEEELEKLVHSVFVRLRGLIHRLPDFSPCDTDRETAAAVAPVLRMLYGGVDGKVCFTANTELLRFAASRAAFERLAVPFTPDQIVYCRAEPLFLHAGQTTPDALRRACGAYREAHGYAPKVVVLQGVGMFACGMSQKDAETVRDVFLDAIAVSVYAESFGGQLPMADDLVQFITHWEAESYRAGIGTDSSTEGPLRGRIALVVHACGRFGAGLCEALCSAGAYVTVADCQDAAESFREKLEKAVPDAVIAVAERETDTEEDIRAIICDTVLQFGGIDLVLYPTLPDEELQSHLHIPSPTQVRDCYIAVCKYASRPMALEHEIDPCFFTDLIEVGPKNDALRQTAAALLEHGIKVNAIRPALGTDTPFGRGCTDEDLRLALYYLVEQQFETSLALPVSGGSRLNRV